MLRRAFWALVVTLCLAAPAALQAQMGDYLDVYVAHVKPEKTTDFEALAKKMADANRRFNGDRWLTESAVYGEGETYVFVSQRQDYADADKGTDAFFGALSKAYGKDGADKMLHEWESCLLSSHTELRKRRTDLSRKAPDAASWAKFIGESRVLRTTAVHVKPGRITEFEDLLKDMKTAGEQSPNTQPVLVSQVIEGGRGTIFYLTTLRNSLAGFDNNPTMRQILGEEGYKKFLQISAESIERADSTIYRFSAELSNPAPEVIAAAPDYWQPKPVVAAHAAKPKSPVQPAAEKEKTKQ